MLLDTIGNTSIFSLKNIVKPNRIFVKLEKQNPGSSVKDRTAYFMILDAEARGALGGEKKTIVEPTSGNTGIALSMIGAQRGYKVILTMPSNMSKERVELLKVLGAEVILTPPDKGMMGAIQKAKEIREDMDAFMPDQFVNPANVLAHELTTGPEILIQMSYDIDIFVTGIGTGGTITGIGRCLRKALGNKVKIIGVEPKGSPIISQGISGKHNIQGIGAGFIPPILDLDLLDDMILVGDDEALFMMKRLAREEGFFGGISTGANVYAAVSLLKRYGEHVRIVTISPDSIEKYLSVAVSL